MEGLYGKVHGSRYRKELEQAIKADDEILVGQLREQYLVRMYDLSSFMKDLKQRFTQWYNGMNDRKGTLWEERFKSILVEGSPNALAAIGAYIDLNAVRAGLVKDPKDYRYCGYSEALAGNKRAQRGIVKMLNVFNPNGNWKTIRGIYRVHLYGVGEERGLSDENVLRPGFNREEILKVVENGGKLSARELLHCRIRYFSDGLVLGCAEFVENFFRRNQRYFSPRKKKGSYPIPLVPFEDLCTIKPLKDDAIC